VREQQPCGPPLDVLGACLESDLSLESVKDLLRLAHGERERVDDDRGRWQASGTDRANGAPSGRLARTAHTLDPHRRHESQRCPSEECAIVGD
jgi:hypothetical protein